ncbi:MAG: hypothetical protein ACR2JD_07805 [Nocardioides sp.]
MTTVDLSTPRPAPESLLDGLPRRVALTLPELRLVAERAGNAPLPFDVTEPRPGALDDRMGQSRGSAEDAAYHAALGSLHEPLDSLTRRGLIVDDVLDAGLAGAVGLLATPSVALDLDVRVGDVQAKAWHREAAGAVATLATVDGLVFELAWFDTPQWPAELARVAVVPEDMTMAESTVPAHLDLPFDLVSAASEAVRTGRADLLGVLVVQHSGRVLDRDGIAVHDSDVQTLLVGGYDEARGRMRALVTDVASGDAAVVGVVSWVLLNDGWRALRPHHAGVEPRVEIRRVEPADLATELAPVLAEVAR